MVTGTQDAPRASYLLDHHWMEAGWLDARDGKGAAMRAVRNPELKESDMSGKAAVVLVHGAFANSTTWNLVLAALADQDVDAIAVANPLRSLHGDATYVRDVVKSVGLPVILVGHAYGGMVITEAATDNDAVRGLVYVAAFTPEPGESVRDLATKFAVSTPGSVLQS